VTVRLLNSDQLDLVGFTFDAGTTRLFTPNAGGGGTLTISENGTPIDSIVFANGTYTTANFVLSEDSTNNGILVVDPASTSNTVSTVSAVAVATGTQTTVGVTDAPINMALSNPPAANGQPVTVTVAGLPSDWKLNQGTNLGNGTWMVETNDLTALTVLTAAAYARAMMLGVTETWTNADGSVGTALVRDNVEAYAPGSPVFALSGDDTLTGAGANDLFVFAQPIGNDIIYHFNVASDELGPNVSVTVGPDGDHFAFMPGIGTKTGTNFNWQQDTIEFDQFATAQTVQELESLITTDTHGDAVINLGRNDSITPTGTTTTELQQAIQAGHVLLH